MTSKTVEFHEEARLESAAAFEWYFERSEMAASRFVVQLNRAIALIAEAPQRWPTGFVEPGDSCSSDFLSQWCIANSPAKSKCWQWLTATVGQDTGKADSNWPCSIPGYWATQRFTADLILRRCYATHFMVSFLRFLAQSRR